MIWVSLFDGMSCGRLQTVPEHMIDKMIASGVSNTQLYKMLGNGWTIYVIVHLFILMYIQRMLRHA